MRLVLVGLLIIAPYVGLSAQSTQRIAIFVGPQVRDGFVDADRGVLDSVRDIQNELKNARDLVAVPRSEDATIVLTILGRGIPGAAGAVGVPIGAIAVMVPINRRVIDATLRVGTYELKISSEDRDHDNWRAVAKQLVKDLRAWVEANRDAVARRR